MRKPCNTALMSVRHHSNDPSGPADSREEIILALEELFRRRGYDGVSIADISAATGLGKSSLYHHFPGGKPDMARAVADYDHAYLRAHVFAPLHADAPLAKKITAMMKAVDEIYQGGSAPCVVASLMSAPEEAGLQDVVAPIVAEWIDAIAAALKMAGAKPADAQRRASAALVAIQGGLTVARATGRLEIFKDALKSARGLLLA
jgi:AcrR family transcriptional regulator